MESQKTSGELICFEGKSRLRRHRDLELRERGAIGLDLFPPGGQLIGRRRGLSGGNGRARKQSPSQFSSPHMAILAETSRPSKTNHNLPL